MSAARLKEKLKRFVELDGSDKWLFLRAVGWLAVARMMLIITPFKQLSAKFSAKPHADSVDPDPDYLRRVSFAVSAAANNVPWRSDCFPQAIAARILLNRKGYDSTIHLGVERTGSNTVAGHAWLTCGDTTVTGGEQADHFAEIHRLGE